MVKNSKELISKKLLIKYLFPSDNLLSFFQEQLFEELKVVIPEKLCYSKDNTSARIRSFNKSECLNLLREFFIKNKVYKEEVESLYNSNIENILDNILQGYIFLLKNGIDPIGDKYSVCFLEGFVIDDLI